MMDPVSHILQPNAGPNVHSSASAELSKCGARTRPHMDTSSDCAMEHLVTELNILLKMLDQENLSSATTEKKRTVGNLLKELKPPVNGTDYIYVNTTLCGNGTSFVESLFQDFGPPAPPLPTTPPPEDYYEEADPLSPGKVPQYITATNCSSRPNSIEDGYYEDADENYPSTQINGPHKSSDNDSDALSSSYESYDEEEDEAKARRLTGQWPLEEDSVGPAKDCRICAFLLRKKRFGQWTKQLTLVRDNRLQVNPLNGDSCRTVIRPCYKKAKDHMPYIDLPLDLCNVIYVPKDGRRKKHELRFSLPGSEALVLAVQSKEQAEGWLKVPRHRSAWQRPLPPALLFILCSFSLYLVLTLASPQVIREVSSQGSVNYGMDGSTSPMILRKMELDQVILVFTRGCVQTSIPLTQIAWPQGTARPMGWAAGRKITQIISFPRKKLPLPRDPFKALPNDSDPRCGYLRVLTDQGWKERWCCVRGGSLSLLRSREGPHTHIGMVPLSDCEVAPGLSPKHPFAFRILREGKEVATLEASCSEEMGRWLGMLLAETGNASDPDVLHYDYVDVDTVASIRDAVRHSFLWATSSSSASTDSKKYDEAAYEGVQLGGEQSQKSDSRGKRVTQRVVLQAPGKGQSSNTNHYGRYGKTRAEEDARRYLREKEELEQKREGIRSALLSLRKEKREVREGLKSATGEQVKALEQRLAHLEESCREKEGERVDLELRLTEVKENLKKSLAGGMLGAPVESKPTRKVLTSKHAFETLGHDLSNAFLKAQLSKKNSPNSEASLPVNCSSEIRKIPVSVCAPSSGNVMQKAKEWESKKEI
ncbi:actin filament-associated protein 1-like 1-like [Scleropages formosus]|uniref:Actin filament-associated protein 1-like 1 n=1 Tax=Scleropages formosus TaxID=113540 RepID=A0A0P7U8R2_SCLFO|nr:actin filament-associated protein 1-like 1-like [Scleropages formosus]